MHRRRQKQTEVGGTASNTFKACQQKMQGCNESKMNTKPLHCFTSRWSRGKGEPRVEASLSRGAKSSTAEY
jgi:hypothetical protein